MILRFIVCPPRKDFKKKTAHSGEHAALRLDVVEFALEDLVFGALEDAVSVDVPAVQVVVSGGTALEQVRDPFCLPGPEAHD